VLGSVAYYGNNPKCPFFGDNGTNETNEGHRSRKPGYKKGLVGDEACVCKMMRHVCVR